jgi:hypothetical protein
MRTRKESVGAKRKMDRGKKEKLAKQEVVKQVEVEVEGDKEIAPLTP